MFRRLNIVALLLGALILSGCKSIPSTQYNPYSQFVGLSKFGNFTISRSDSGELTLLSPKIRPGGEWNELIVSWNANAPAGSYLKVEAQAEGDNHRSKFYTLGLWTPDDKAFPRASVSEQKDGDGNVLVDTLALNWPARTVQLKLTLGGTPEALPALKFLGLSFCNTKRQPETLSSSHAAWGKILPVIERSQQTYPGGNGWCSPTSLSMVLTYWGTEKFWPEWSHDAPEVAAGVFDHNFKKATGNWSFNVAYAGTLPGMRAYVTRLSDLSELEQWIDAGFPVIISARYDLLQDGRPDDFNGHLTVCRGFTENGDVIINDPWTDPKAENIRHVYKRENVRRAWATSHNTVYLVYPEKATVPHDELGHWFR